MVVAARVVPCLLLLATLATGDVEESTCQTVAGRRPDNKSPTLLAVQSTLHRKPARPSEPEESAESAIAEPLPEVAKSALRAAAGGPLSFTGKPGEPAPSAVDPNAADEPESAPPWYITMLVGFSAAFIIFLALMLTLALLQLCVNLQQRWMESLANAKRSEEARKAPSGAGAQSTSALAPVAGEVSEYDAAALINGDAERLGLLLDIARATSPPAAAGEIVKKGVRANKVRLSEESTREIVDGVVCLAKAAEKMNARHKPGRSARERLSAALHDVRGMVKVRRAFQLPTHDHEERAMTRENDEAVVQNYANGAAPAKRRDMRIQPQSRMGAYFASERWIDDAGILLIAVYSQLCGVIYATYLRFRFPKMFQFLGPWVLVSRGEAMAAIVLSVLMILLLTRGFVTQLRKVSQWSTVLANMVDKNILMHQWCGIMLPAVGALHVLGHLRGAIPAIIAEHDNSKINDVFTYGTKIKFNFNSWGGALQCYPAVTGYILILILVAFWLFSNEKVRRKYFELFQYPHFILMVAWALGLWAHGARQWLGCGVPLGLLAVVPVLLFYIATRVYDILQGSDGTIQITNAIIKKKTVHLEIDVSRSNFNYKTGMYCMLKVPKISDLQWHPFTIASAGGSPKLQILFAEAGNWTSQFKELLEVAQKNGMSYPPIAVRGGYGAPAQSMQGSKNCIMVGAGVGATPFLSFLDSICQTATRGEKSEYDNIESAVFYWVSREPEDFVWVNDYGSVISKTPSLRDRISLRLCLSKSMDLASAADGSAAEVAMFWLGTQIALTNGPSSGSALASELGAPTKFGRPDWKKELQQHGGQLLLKRAPEDSEKVHISVFVCGNSMLVDSLQKACEELSNDDLEFRIFAEQF